MLAGQSNYNMQARLQGDCLISLTRENQTETKGYLVEMDFEWKDLGRAMERR